MGRKKSDFILVLILGILLLCSLTISKELFRELTCYRDTLQLDCGSQNIIAIHQAYFTSQRQENHTCHLIEHDYVEDDASAKFINNSYCYEDVRVSINKRCSGIRHCNFTYSDEMEKQCSNAEGLLIVQYDCVRTENINKYCNAKITATEGYIMQPGYPQYYAKLECSWSLSAADGQTINVKILHLHLSAATEVVPTPPDHEMYVIGIGQSTEQIKNCDRDSLSVLDGNIKQFSVCGQNLEGLRNVETDASNDLVLKFKSSGFAPSSGFLAYFKVEGCPDMPAGEHGYLVERNSTAAVYSCRNNMVFNDTLENTRFLYCIRNHHWSNTLSPCIQLIEETTFKSIVSITAKEQLLENVTSRSLNESFTTTHAEPRFIEDIMIPCIIIAILIVGNSIIIVIICIMRRNHRKKEQEEDDEENDFEEPDTTNP